MRLPRCFRWARLVLNPAQFFDKFPAEMVGECFAKQEKAL